MPSAGRSRPNPGSDSKNSVHDCLQLCSQRNRESSRTNVPFLHQDNPRLLLLLDHVFPEILGGVPGGHSKLVGVPATPARCSVPRPHQRDAVSRISCTVFKVQCPQPSIPVTLDGSPLKKASVVFQPDGGRPSFSQDPGTQHIGGWPRDVSEVQCPQPSSPAIYPQPCWTLESRDTARQWLDATSARSRSLLDTVTHVPMDTCW